MMSERFSQYSDIIVSVEAASASASFSLHEYSKIALPTTESATLKYLDRRFPIYTVRVCKRYALSGDARS